MHSSKTIKPAREAVTIEIEDVDEGESLEKRIGERLRRTFESPNYRPPALPSVALELMSVSSKPSVTVKELVELLEKDALLAGRLLRLVASPAYAGLVPILSLKQAVVRLGLERLREAVLEAALNMRVFHSKEYAGPMEALRKHSTATAYLSRLVCRYSSMEGEQAFLCGLLHDVGTAAMLIALSEAPRNEPPPPFEKLPAVLDALHEQVGGLVLRSWSARPEIELVVGNHHRPTVQGHAHPLVAVLVVAESLATTLGYGNVEASANPGVKRLDVQGAASILRLSAMQLELLEKDARVAREAWDAL